MDDYYAHLFTRVKAAFIDSIAFVILIYSATEVFNLIENVPNYVRIVTFLSVFVLYEPILISIYGATAGHFFNDIVVKRESDETKNVIFIYALGRFLTKVLLGWISLLTVNGDSKMKAIHDYVGKSVVLQYKTKLST